ncbi:MAG: TlpA family protein disulfide reductase [Planctomycetaceae bacterium]
MSARMLRNSLWVVLLAGCLAFAGCSKSEEVADGKAVAPPGNSALPTAAIGEAKIASDDDDEADPDDDDLASPKVEPKEGTAEWMVREAMKLRLSAPPETEDVEALKKHRAQRNEKIIQLCQEAIAKTHGEGEKERVFNFAVQNLLEARLQLALAGQRDHVEALYEDARALYKRDANSAAAAEGACALVNLAYNRAKQGADDHHDWLKEFARQATHFAENFPADLHRSLPLLFTAGRSCELGGLTPEAIAAYTVLQQKFPQSQYGAHATAILRRLKLPGNPPQLAGPTSDGEQFVVDDLLGKVVLVVFWSSEARPFVDKLPQLLETTRALMKQDVQIVGVNLDSQPTAASQFIVQHKLPWPQIIFTEQGQQGWGNPIAVYYGIMEIPAIWLIDQSGNVVSTSLTAEEIASAAGKLQGDRNPEGAAGDPARTLDRPRRRTERQPPREEAE